MKKLITLILVLILIFTMAVPALGTQDEPAMPYLLNTKLASAKLSISDTGLAEVVVTYVK